MTAALSSGLSWLLIGAVAGFAIFVYVYAVGSSWFDAADRELARLARADRAAARTDSTWHAAYDDPKRTAPPYDHESHGDFR